MHAAFSGPTEYTMLLFKLSLIMFPQSGFSYDNSFLQYLFGILYRQHTMPIKFSLRVFLSFSHHFLNGSREWEGLGRTSRHLPQLDASLC